VARFVKIRKRATASDAFGKNNETHHYFKYAVNTHLKFYLKFYYLKF
jgi:hypothetical protein